MKPGVRPPRVVIDTNLVLSALVFAQGRLTRLRQAWQADCMHKLWFPERRLPNSSARLATRNSD